MENQELIVVEQLPIIVQRLQSISNEIMERTQYVLSLEVNEDTYKEIKKMRADLNSSFNGLEDKRKEVKALILAPYNEFEEEYKKYVTNIFKPAKEQLDQRISDVENGLKEKKAVEARAYFEEYSQSCGIDFLTFDNMGLNITLNSSKKSLMDKIKTTIDRVVDDLKMIDTQAYKAEILVEYKKSLNVSQAIVLVTNRMNAIEEEKRRAEAAAIQAAQKADVAAKVDEAIEETVSAPVVLEPPVIEEAPIEADVEDNTPTITVYQLGFKVKTKNIEHLRSIKQLLEKLKEEGLEYEQC